MNSDIISHSVAQMVVNAPELIVDFIAIVLALKFWRRCPVPSLLTLVAAGLLLGTTLLEGFLYYFLGNIIGDEWGTLTLSTMAVIVGFGGSLLHAVGVGLLLTAVFIGRKEPPQRRLPPEEPLSVPSSGSSEDRGISTRPLR